MDESVRLHLTEAVELATLAPSTHNTQPWKFSLHDDCIRVYPDLSRKLAVLDPRGRELYISVGCAVENLAIALDHAGYGPQVEVFPPDEEEECVRILFSGGRKGRQEELFQQLRLRQTRRGIYDGLPLSAAVEAKLRELSLEEGVSLTLLTSGPEMRALMDLVLEADRRQLGDPAFREELTRWIRFSETEARRRGDGLSTESMGMPSGPRWLGSFFLSRAHGVAGAKAERDEALLLASSAVAIFSSFSNDRPSWIRVGRSFERFCLQTTALGLSHSHMNQPIEVIELRSRLEKSLVAPHGPQHPQMIVRLGYGRPEPRSVRRPMDEVLTMSIDEFRGGS